VVLLLVGVVALTVGLRGWDGPPQPSSAPVPTATHTPSTSPSTATSGSPSPTPSTSATSGPATPVPPASIGPFLAAAAPTRIDIPSIGLHSTALVGLEIGTDGTLTPPATAQQVGWWTGGPTPGQLGPAVIGAHVDSKQGPGVFYRLGAMRKGERFTLARVDGSVLTFVVDKVASYAKDAFPTEEVYRGAFDRSEIRLITCGGTFDPVKHYLDNVVVFGHLESVA
jgi:hypothetical protein